MKKIRVLQFPIANTAGGITQYALNNWNYIDRNRFQFDFATLNKVKLDFEDKLLEEGCRVHHISCYAEDNETQFRSEMNRILDIGYDVVHLHTRYWKSFLVEELAKKKNIPKVIVHSHNTNVGENDELKRNELIELHQKRKQELTEEIATDFWACSEMAADWLYGNRIPKERIKIFHNAIDVMNYKYDEEIRSEYRKKYHLENKFVIGHVGRFEYPKNHEFLIDVFYEICKENENAVLVFIGKGTLESIIKEKIKNLGREERVIFLGVRNDVNAWMQAMDLFCFPSLFEGLPLVLIEAQAAGLHCLAGENIPREAKLTQDVHYLSYKKALWRDKIMEEMEFRERFDTSDIITAAGYDIRTQIKELEKGYLDNKHNLTKISQIYGGGGNKYN